ncbi:phage recombination protein Bet [Listeria monocytogenes]|nr:phage recombination protein Bet [Listeria monocytogenes]EAF5440073.1 phage recombination protein Bet [Listeria monocytogenes]ECK4904261.1 phage recombination protein Bet [Listeria monocytogenes]
MTNEVNNIAHVDLLNKSTVFEVNGEEVKLSGNIIKKYLVSGEAEVTDQEVIMFLQLCKYQKLNPFLNEAYLVKFKNTKGPDKPAQIIVSKEAFMKRAETHEQYDGFEAGIIVERDGEVVEIEGAVSLDKDKLLGGWAKVFRKDRSRPVSVRISEKEFNKRQSTWNAMPLTMMRKTAVVNAMREAFPDNLGAMYTEEEQQGSIQNNETSVQEEIRQNANTEILDIQAQQNEVPDFKEVREPVPVERSQVYDEQQSTQPARPY